jgi:hypothetical protein
VGPDRHRSSITEQVSRESRGVCRLRAERRARSHGQNVAVVSRREPSDARSMDEA